MPKRCLPERFVWPLRVANVVASGLGGALAGPAHASRPACRGRAHVTVARPLRGRERPRWGLWLGAFFALVLETSATAQDRPPASDAALEIPPAPSLAKPRLAFDVHTGFSFPLGVSSVCPKGAGCVLQGGGGVGATVEKRSPRGFGLFGGYDAWFLDTDSVYELGVQQLLRAGVRFTLPADIVFHPLVEFSGGLMVYGDTFKAATAGVLAQALTGAEVELTAEAALRLGIGLRAFSHSKFRTARDGVWRGGGGGISQMLFLEAGLLFM